MHLEIRCLLTFNSYFCKETRIIIHAIGIIFKHLLLKMLLMVVKGCVRYIFAGLFFKSKGVPTKLRKIFFISLQKLFSFSKKLKKKKLSKVSSKIATCKLVPDPFFKHNLYWKMKFLKQATSIRYVIAKLSTFVQISMQTS